ncbi:MAG: bifunctional oligoribonuclease/PAP phosphatase NrnA [Bacilli bacterium]|nr:bifunctional oligoribonuclease/PAP phosphatase NrnA [Bacilli bacterium]
MLKQKIKNIYRKIKEYNNIVIARHISPDPDAIASQIALRDSIKLSFPKKNVYAVGVSVAKFKSYGNLDKIDESKLDGDVLLLVLDVPNKARIDGVDFNLFKEVIKIDHHPSEEVFSEYDWVDESSSSTCQLIIELILSTRLELDRKIAENLFLGVVSDSDRFLISYTSSKTFRLISDLIDRTGIDFTNLYPILYERPYNEIKFHGYLSSSLNITENGFAYLNITPEILKEYNVDSATPANMINDFSNIKDVYVWTFITFDEKVNLYKINIRSKGPVINETAAKYGGGGHKFASGIRTPNKDDIDKIIRDLDLDCKKYKEDLDKSI